ncbi:hypothetical protein V6N13_021251 [Hibiscus sabdariffa]
MVYTADDWMWDQVEHLLSTPILLRLVAIKWPRPWLSRDDVGSHKSVDWRFSIKAAYEGMIEPAPSNTLEVRRLLHKFSGLQRMEIFMWLACNGKCLILAEANGIQEHNKLQPLVLLGKLRQLESYESLTTNLLATSFVQNECPVNSQPKIEFTIAASTGATTPPKLS